MPSVSHETSEQIDARLRGVLAASELVLERGAWQWIESPRNAGVQWLPYALAAVRDNEVDSQLVPAVDGGGQKLAVFSFHFPPAVDNSGFVGWLASELKASVGTGVIVVCGSNSARGGIFDYWAVPESVRDEAVAVIVRLGGRARNNPDCSQLLE